MPSGNPTVVFLDHCTYDCFFQLAGKLRRAGIRTVRVTSDPARSAVWQSAPVFDRHLTVSKSSHSTFGDLLSSEEVVDLQFTEHMHWLVSQYSDRLRPPVGRRIERRLEILDKFETARLLLTNGIPVPPVIEAGETTPEAALAELGAPLVLKAKIGTGGEQMRISGDVGEMRSLMQSSGLGPNDFFYEQFIEGSDVIYGAAITDDGGVVQDLAGEIGRSWRAGFGPAGLTWADQDPELLATGRKAASVLKTAGLVSMNFKKDFDGRLWLHDINIRSSGFHGAYCAAGLDLSEGYLYALGLRKSLPTSVAPEVGKKVPIFPQCVRPYVEERKYGKAALEFARGALPSAKEFGLGTMISQAVRVGTDIYRPKADGIG